MQDVNFFTGTGKKHTLQVTFDIINIMNLIDKNLGWYYFAPNTYNNSVFTGITNTGVQDATGKNLGLPDMYFVRPQATYSTDPFASRFQCQLGLRYLF